MWVGKQSRFINALGYESRRGRRVQQEVRVVLPTSTEENH